MSKQLLSKTQKQIQNSIKSIKPFNLPLDNTHAFPIETKNEWLEEMNQEESNMTHDQKLQAEKQGQQQLERMRQLYPHKFKNIGL